jgi:hypothetical protein
MHIYVLEVNLHNSIAMFSLKSLTFKILDPAHEMYKCKQTQFHALDFLIRNCIAVPHCKTEIKYINFGIRVSFCNDLINTWKVIWKVSLEKLHPLTNLRALLKRSTYY